MESNFTSGKDIPEVDTKKLLGHVFAEYEYDMKPKDAILYSLSLGFNADPLKKDEYQFTYENAQGFTPYPTMPVVMAHQDYAAFLSTPGLPDINPIMILHRAEDVNIIKPLEAGRKYKVTEIARDIQDKTKLTVVVGESIISDAENPKDVYAVVTGQTIIRGLGGFGFKGATKLTDVPPKPKEQPTYSVETKIQPGQAFLYRLNGDLNPLHVDPDMAKIANFHMPIIHGLCTKGVVSKAVYEKFAHNHPELVKRVFSKFVGHVFPGESLIVDMWKLPNTNTIYYEAKVKERGTVALKGLMELRDQAKL